MTILSRLVLKFSLPRLTPEKLNLKKLALLKTGFKEMALLTLILGLSACSSKPSVEPTSKPAKLDEAQLEQIINNSLQTHLNSALTRQKRTLLQQINYHAREREQQHSQLIQQLQNHNAQPQNRPISNTQTNIGTCQRPSYDTPIIGELEHVYIAGLQASFIGRVDSGIALSQLSVHNLISFKRNGDPWVRFDVYIRGPEAPAQSFESRVERFTRLEHDDHANNNQSSTRAPVIYSMLNIGQYSKNAEVILTKQTQATPLILGRSFLTGFAIIDLQKQYNLGRISP